MASPTPGTLNEFDMVLSVTEASLNAQFLALYKTRLPDSKDDDNEETLETAKYLISHRFLLSKPKSRVGIDGHIECPRVDMNLEGNNTVKRTVRVVINFLKNTPGTKADIVNGTPAYDPKYDSCFNYWDSDDDDRKLVKQSMNGWQFTFEAGLGRADIQQIEERHTRYFHPETYQKLKKGVDEKLFMPSSVFCLFEAGQIAKSFKLYDENGQLVTGSTQKKGPDGQDVNFGSIIDDFIVVITRRFADTSSQDVKPGIPNPQRPFVLGYGISQPDPEPLPSEPWFIPQNFQFSVTHAPGGFGTLNFLMLLNQIQPIQNVEHNLNAGIFSELFMDRIGASTPNPKTKRPQYDGTMAISAKSFKEQYILKRLLSHFKLPDPAISSRTITREKDETTNPSINSCTHTTSWTSDKGKNGRSWYWGTNTTTITVTSNYTGQPMSTDAQRCLIIDVNGTLDMNYKETVWGLFQDSSFTHGLTAPFKLRFIATANTLGAWAIRRDDDSKFTSIPLMEDDPKNSGAKRLVLSPINSGKPGIVPRTDHTGPVAFEGFLDVLAVYSYLGAFTGAAATGILNMYEKQIAGSLETLAAQIVMPAGNVFFFNGLSTDTDHHLYSLIKYQTRSGGEQFETPS